MKSDFWRRHLPLYIVLLIGITLSYLSGNHLYWQFYISGSTILITILFFVWYGPKKVDKPGKS